MWNYAISGQQKGPIDEQQLVRMVNAGQISPDTPVWTQGMGAWVRANQTIFANKLRVPPATPQPIQGNIYQAHQADQKDRTAYVLLAVLLGIGGHNLYAGYTTKGVIQLIGVLFTCGVLWIPIWIWSIIEAIMVTEDGKGVRFK